MTPKPAGRPFVKEVRHALHHLYDPPQLRKSALGALFGVAEAEDVAAALRRILTEAIEALKPDADVPAQASAWRTYHVLYQRYTEQFTQRQVATDLGLSIRQLRREEAAALQVLAGRLGAEYGIGPDESVAPSAVASDSETRTPSREEELAWVKQSLPNEPVDLEGVCRAVLKLIDPLTRSLEVSVDCELPQGLPRAAGQPATLRQALLNTLTAVVCSAPHGRVLVDAQARGTRIHLRILPSARRAAAGPSDSHAEGLEMARQLVGLSGGVAEVLPGENAQEPFRVQWTLPSAEQVTVLVIDDNADTLQLLKRYLAGSRYRFVGTPDPEQALALAAEQRPQIVVLDIMLPGIDGWEVLGRLREHPEMQGVPIILCTILPQEQLAEALGAAGFMRKPVSRVSFLAALDRQLDRLPRGSG